MNYSLKVTDPETGAVIVPETKLHSKSTLDYVIFVQTTLTPKQREKFIEEVHKNGSAESIAYESDTRGGAYHLVVMKVVDAK